MFNRQDSVTKPVAKSVGTFARIGMAVVIDDKSEPGSWQFALDRGCLSGRVAEQPPVTRPVARDASPFPPDTDNAEARADAAC